MAMADRLLVSLFEHKAWCNARLAEALAAAPAEVDRRQWAVILFTFDHTAIVDRVFKARLMGEEPKVASTVATTWPDLGALTASMAETDAWYLDYVRRVTPDELDCSIDFAFVDDGAPGRMARGDMLAHVITHGASHRGAIGKMLEGLGVPGASDMVTTFRRLDAA
jgi:uncharacterized damage-inducible protein DinB